MSIEAALRRQAGVISRAQALEAGMSADQINRRLAGTRWTLLHPQVYLAADRDLTGEGAIRGAALWAGEQATVSGLAAAWWHRLLPEPPVVVEITIPVRRSLRPRRGVRIRRRELAEVDRITTRGLALTALPLTILETAVALGERGSQLLDQALQRRVGFDALRRAHCRNLGRRGSTTASRLLAAAADRAASMAERKMIGLLRAAHLTGWQRHYRFAGYELDLAFPAHRVAIEIDGWAFHQDSRSFQSDRIRQNALVLAGWTVLRFTWHDLTERPDQVMAEIRIALGTA